MAHDYFLILSVMEYAEKKGGWKNVVTLEVQCMEAIIPEKALDLPLHLYAAVEGQNSSPQDPTVFGGIKSADVPVDYTDWKTGI